MKSAFITGGSRGLGLEIARKFLSEGWKVFTVSRSKTNDILELKNNYASHFHHKCFDLSHTEGLK